MISGQHQGARSSKAVLGCQFGFYCEMESHCGVFRKEAICSNSVLKEPLTGV